MTTKTAILNVRTDAKTKKAAQKAAKELGVSLSFIVNMLLREFVSNPRQTLLNYSIAIPDKSSTGTR